MRTLFLTLFLLFKVFVLFSQNFQLIESIEIKEPTEVSLDRAGNIYYATFNGDIIKYNPLLKERFIFSPANPNKTTILEAWQGLRIFSFHRDMQQYRLINRNLSLNEDYSFPTNLVGFAEIATPSYDNNIWVIDQIDFSLKKYDIFSKRIKSRTPMDLLLNPDNYEILYCKEYQNRLFISTRNYGILIFDNFGNYIKTYENKGVSSFNFWKDTIYFMEENVLVKLNLYNNRTDYSELPKQENWLFALVFEDRTYLFSDNKLS
ncbi:MAG: hypothetical protein KAK04_13590, partial [Cyclobacteriaceae bacterium]|nr:hypothetical protein [Cyclobacteriaceae bacterium]